jgi:16S rRNA (cytidine1402-2'-O)-methyltransferase
MSSGLSFSEYTFVGFLSNRSSRRKKALSEYSGRHTVFVFFESPHRILAFLEDALEAFGPVQGCVGKEMTKKFETFYRGDLALIIRIIRENGVKGEYTVIIDNRPRSEYK